MFRISVQASDFRLPTSDFRPLAFGFVFILRRVLGITRFSALPPLVHLFAHSLVRSFTRLSNTFDAMASHANSNHSSTQLVDRDHVPTLHPRYTCITIYTPATAARPARQRGPLLLFSLCLAFRISPLHSAQTFLTLYCPHSSIAVYQYSIHSAPSASHLPYSY